MSKRQIDEAFKRFFDPQAAKKGSKQATIKVLGGHGNGGKFYMRQMFKTARAITYRDGKMNIFGFNPKHQYGFEEGFEDQKMSFTKAIEKGGIANIRLPPGVTQELEPGKACFTVLT